MDETMKCLPSSSKLPVPRPTSKPADKKYTRYCSKSDAQSKIRTWPTTFNCIRISKGGFLGSLCGHFARESFRHGYLATYFRTRNIIFEACLFWFIAYMTRYITFEARLFGLRFRERGIYLERAKWLENRGRRNRGEMTGCRGFDSQGKTNTRGLKMTEK